MVDTLAKTHANAPQAAEPPAARPYNHTADFVRVALFTLVVASHTHGTTPDVAGGTGLMATVAHTTRYGFVAITVFVLFLGYSGRKVSPLAFWRRRFGQVVLPYLAWSVLYTVFLVWWDDSTPMPGPRDLARDSAHSVLTGDGRYHLYFLLISMQIYLLFPALQWLITRTAGHHLELLVGALAVQWAMFAFFDWPGAPELLGWGAYLHLWKTLPMYALFAVIGALLAVHFDRADAWIRANLPLVVGAAAVGCAYGIAGHLRDVAAEGIDPMRTSAAWNPQFLPLFVGTLTLIYLVGMAWNDHRGDGTGPVARVVSYGALRAFGVFAVHPMMIDVVYRVLPVDPLLDPVPPLRSTVLTVIVLAASLAVVEIALRTPLSTVLVARPRRPLWRRERRGGPAASGAGTPGATVGTLGDPDSAGAGANRPVVANPAAGKAATTE
ncbi:acyltransferase [Nocardia grenadensis]|uniref:acyltransferase n=1 Tax=Nocardia grenadensis TaxID=931537 RepID=UPI003D760ED6